MNSRVCVLCAVAFLIASGVRAGESQDQRAKTILTETGVHGGLIVHVGCGDGKLTAALGRSNGFLVQGIDPSPEHVAAARKHVRGLGRYGKVSISRWEGDKLPYVDNLVNLLVVEVQSPPARDEMLRVLTPQGTAYIKNGDRWEKLIKPRPAEMDAWTHYMYDATGNAVSKDTLVAPPKHQQWVGGPRWGRHHDHMASMTSMVASATRLFYIFDEGSTSSIMLPSKWHLIARDAFNGVVLWKKPLPQWWTRFHPLKSGPAELPRLLVVDSEHVYAPLGLREPVSQLDAVSGKTQQTYQGTENTWELIVSDGMLYAVTGSPRTKEEAEAKMLFAKQSRAPGNPFSAGWKNWDRKLVVVNTETGKIEWQKPSIILPGTLAADGDSVYFHNNKRIVALGKQTGEKRWVSDPVAAIDITKGIPTGYMPSLAVSDGVVVFAGGSNYAQHMKGKTDQMVGLSAKDGKLLWEAPHYTSGYQSPMDLLVVNRMVLSPFSTWLKPKDPKDNVVAASDVLTGKHIQDYRENVKDPVWFIHHRCHPSKATVNYLLMSKEGIEFIDLKTKKWTINHWIRGACLYGIMPANGLIYASMHSCACSADMKLNGLNAVAGARARTDSKVNVEKHLLTKGPAFGKVGDVPEAKPGDWPTFRHDAARSGVATCAASDSLERAWGASIGGRLSAPVVAEGKVFVASVHRHTLYALDETSGKTLWTFTAGGRIDSPPTTYKGMVVFGSMDGCVYCLRASDGAVVWRFRAVAEDRRLMAWEQVESVWPIHGSVLIRNDEAWFVAGRSSFLDGGLQMYRLKPETGEVISQATFEGKTDDGGVLMGSEEKRLVGLPDILSASDDCVFMRAGVFRLEGNTIKRKLLPPGKVYRYPGNKAVASKMPTEVKVHLFSSYGFLDDSWLHRSYWLYADFCSGRHSYFRTGSQRPAGRILVVDDQNVYGFGRQKKYFNWTTPMEYRFFADPKKGKPSAKPKGKRKGRGPNRSLWETKAPILATGLVLAGEALFAAGAPDVFDETQPSARNEGPKVLKEMNEQEAALAGKHGGILIAVSRKDGKQRKRYDLDAPPVFDGLIAANGRLYMALKDGTLQCWKNSE